MNSSGVTTSTAMPQAIEPTAGADLGGLFEVVVKVRSEDTNGVLAAVEQTVPPRKLIPPHTHENDVWVYVLTGEIGILVGDEVEHAGAGSWALKPRNVVHAMWNRTDAPGRSRAPRATYGVDAFVGRLAVRRTRRRGLRQ